MNIKINCCGEKRIVPFDGSQHDHLTYVCPVCKRVAKLEIAQIEVKRT